LLRLTPLLQVLLSKEILVAVLKLVLLRQIQMPLTGLRLMVGSLRYKLLGRAVLVGILLELFIGIKQGIWSQLLGALLVTQVIVHHRLLLLFLLDFVR
jgi:hypothetical protein